MLLIVLVLEFADTNNGQAAFQTGAAAPEPPSAAHAGVHMHATMSSANHARSVMLPIVLVLEDADTNNGQAGDCGNADGCALPAAAAALRVTCAMRSRQMGMR